MQNQTVTQRDAKRQERRSRRFWVFVIVGFFAIDVSIAVIAITMAAGDPSFRSIPGYGERAVAWDERRSLKEAWENHHWTIDIRPTGENSNAIEIAINDERKEPVTGCTGTVKLFHYTRVAVQTRGDLTEIAPGHYVANVDVEKPGLWNLELSLLTSQQERCSYESSYEWNTANQRDGHQE